jgi:hypothetical protein
MKVKSLCLHKTAGANNQIKQGDAFLLTRHPIGVAYNTLSAMLTNVFHIFSQEQGACHIGLT